MLIGQWAPEIDLSLPLRAWISYTHYHTQMKKIFKLVWMFCLHVSHVLCALRGQKREQDALTPMLQTAARCHVVLWKRSERSEMNHFSLPCPILLSMLSLEAHTRTWGSNTHPCVCTGKGLPAELSTYPLFNVLTSKRNNFVLSLESP